MRKQLKLNFNMGIASLHEVTTQLIGMQLSGANILALAVSATSVVAGTVSIAVLFYPRAVPLWIIAGLIGAGLAVLFEGLTLGALIRIRLANKKIRTVQAKLEGLWHEQLGKIEQPTPQADLKAYRANVQTYKAALKLTEADHRRKCRNATAEVRRARFWSCSIAFFGTLTSACAGGMFYHTLLDQLAWYQSLGFSALFALAVTVTFVSSELFKDEQEQAIREGFKGGSLTEAAIKQETTRMTYRGVYNESVAFMQTDEARKMIIDGFKEVLSQVIREMKKLEAGEDRPTLSSPQKADASPVRSHEASPVRASEDEAQRDDASAVIEDDASLVIAPLHQDEHRAVKDHDTTPINAIESTPGAVPKADASEDTEVLLRYPGIQEAWFEKGVKSVSVDDIIKVTGQSRQRVVYHARHTFTRTPKNKDRYTLASVLKWLKTAPLPASKNGEAQPVNTLQNGHNEHHCVSQEDILQLEEMPLN